MYLDTLQELGLSQNEAKIYEALVDMKYASVPEISIKIGVHKRNVYDTVPKLLKRGLIYQIVGSRESQYAAVEPSKLEDLIWEKQARLRKILPEMNAHFRKATTSEAVYVYKGVEGFKNYLRDILKVGKDVYFIGAKGGWFDSNLRTFIKRFLRKAKEKNIRYHHIFDAEVKDLAPDLLKILEKPYRFLPSEYSTNGAIDIFGDRIVTFSGLTLKNISDDITLVVIVNRDLANCYRTWFRFMWDAASVF